MTKFLMFTKESCGPCGLVKRYINALKDDRAEVIEEIYLLELSNPNGDLAKSEKLVEEAIEAFDKLIVMINGVKGDNKKSQFKEIQQERKKVMNSLLKKSAAL